MRFTASPIRSKSQLWTHCWVHLCAVAVKSLNMGTTNWYGSYSRKRHVLHHARWWPVVPRLSSINEIQTFMIHMQEVCTSWAPRLHSIVIRSWLILITLHGICNFYGNGMTSQDHGRAWLAEKQTNKQTKTLMCLFATPQCISTSCPVLP